MFVDTESTVDPFRGVYVGMTYKTSWIQLPGVVFIEYFRCKFNWFKNNGDSKTHPKARERFREIPIIIYGEGDEPTQDTPAKKRFTSFCRIFISISPFTDEFVAAPSVAVLHSITLILSHLVLYIVVLARFLQFIIEFVFS